MKPEEPIARFALVPPPEGGFCRRAPCSAGRISPAAAPPASAFSLAGRAVSPGFDLAKPTPGRREEPLTALPDAAARIRQFCPAENGA